MKLDIPPSICVGNFGWGHAGIFSTNSNNALTDSYIHQWIYGDKSSTMGRGPPVCPNYPQRLAQHWVANAMLIGKTTTTPTELYLKDSRIRNNNTSLWSIKWCSSHDPPSNLPIFSFRLRSRCSIEKHQHSLQSMEWSITRSCCRRFKYIVVCETLYDFTCSDSTWCKIY